MEVGAVKQGFNNEIILLKKKLNQAKIQTIHKLTRKAKTLSEKKVPELQKEKYKRKAESAVQEVLIMKKIKARDIARFIVTHTGKLNDYLNTPTVSNDKACARLLLHKAMQEKYKHIREKFSNISIKDLFMSRQERLKLKKEAREKQKNKKKGKNSSEAVHIEGEWDVEITDKNNKIIPGDTKISENYDPSLLEDVELSDNNENNDDSDESENKSISEDEQSNITDDEPNQKSDNSIMNNGLVLSENNHNQDSNNSDSSSISETIGEKPKVLKLKLKNIEDNPNLNSMKNKDLLLSKKTVSKKLAKKPKERKNKNLNKKLENRNFHKDNDEPQEQITKIADPFFITSTGENYMSLVEPRLPDEVKEVHKEGNRKYRRAVMFGHVPRVKPRKNNNKFKDNFNEKGAEDKFGQKQFKGRNNVFNGKNMEKTFKRDDSVDEKLHPSWEAKKKQSAILPFQGKKIVFDES